MQFNATTGAPAATVFPSAGPADSLSTAEPQQPLAEESAVTLHLPAPVEVGRPRLPLGQFAFFANLPRTIIGSVLAPQLDLRAHLVFGTTSHPIETVIDEAGFRSPIYHDFYAPKFAQRQLDQAHAMQAAHLANRESTGAEWAHAANQVNHAQNALVQTRQVRRDQIELDNELRVKRAGFMEDALRACERHEGGVASVPFNARPFVRAATLLMHLEQTELAEKILLRCEALDPNAITVSRQLQKAQWKLGKYDESFATGARCFAADLAAECSFSVFGLLALERPEEAHALAKAQGDTDMLRFLADIARVRETPALASEIAASWETDPRLATCIRASGGDTTATLRFLERVVLEDGWGGLMHELGLPLFHKACDDPRVKFLVARAGLDVEEMRQIKLAIPASFFGEETASEAKAPNSGRKRRHD